MNNIKKIISLFLFLFVAMSGYSQTQQGCVKTRGRIIDGKHVPGKGLTGAVVSIQGRADVGVKRKDGHFSFPATEKQFMVQAVTKKDYILVDADAAPKVYPHTSDTVYFLMETPEQVAQDTLDAMRRIRRTLQRELQKREDEIEALKAEKKISEKEYRAALQKLYDSQGNNEKLISEMAKRYSLLDYDKLDEFYRRVSYSIEQGELTKADSLLRSRGDVESQIKAQHKKGAAIEQKESELRKAKEVYKHENEELARRCYGFYESFKLQNLQDSALHYLELRANIDTTNAEWQFDVAKYSQSQNQFGKSEFYYIRALTLYRRLAESNPSAYEFDVAASLHNLAILYSDTQRFSDAEKMHKESLEIYRRLAKDNPSAYEPYVAHSLNSLAILYSDTQRFSEAEKMYNESLAIRRRLAKDNPSAYEPDVATSLNNLASLYRVTSRFSDAEKMHKESLAISRRLAKDNPTAYEPDVARSLYNLAILYSDTQRFSDAEKMHKESLAISRRLAKDNPSAYEPDVARSLYNLAILYYYTQRFSDAEKMYKESLEIRRRLAKDNPSAYEPDVAASLNNLALLYSNTQRFSEAEQMYNESLEIYRRLAKDNPSAYEPNVAHSLNSLAILYSDTQRFSDAEQMYKESIEIHRRLAKDNPSAYEPYVASSLNNLALLYSNTQRFSDAEKMYNESLEIYRRLYNNNPEQYKKFYAKTLGSQSFNSMFMREFVKAEEYAREGVAVDSSQTFIYANLAASLLMQGKYSEAEKLYRQYKAELKDAFLSDFKEFEEAGVIPEKRRKDVEKIKKMLNE